MPRAVSYLLGGGNGPGRAIDSLALLIIYLWTGCAGAQPPSVETAIPTLSQTTSPAVRPVTIESQARLLQSSPSKPPDSAGASTRPLKGVTAVYLPSHHVPEVTDLEPWIGNLSRAGVTMILLDIGTGPGMRPAAATASGVLGQVYFRTGLADVARDIFGELIPVAHEQGVLVYAAVSLRRMNWVDPVLGWLDRSYDPSRMQLRLSPYLDVFHPAFQEYLMGLFGDLAKSGLDGVLFRSDAPIGPKDGFSPFALQGFERDFKLRIDPARLLTPAGSRPASAREKPVGEGARQGYPAEFWRWAGWKARENLRVMNRMRRAMQPHVPGLVFALEVHPESITDPLSALVQYGEDLLEAKRSGFQCFMTRPLTSAASQTHAAVQDPPMPPPFLERMAQLVGATERIWVPAPLPPGDMSTLPDRVHSALTRSGETRGIGLIYMGN